MSDKHLVWLITGTSSGFGREFVEQLLERGDTVIATARSRSFAKTADLKEKGADTYELDANAPPEVIHEFAKQIIKKHGRVDVLVNNAGYVDFCLSELASPEQTLLQFSTVLFGPMNMNKAFLPHMRERRSGTIVWAGSMAGWVAPRGVSLYCATKHATRALCLALDEEISSFGLRSFCFESGVFRTSALVDDNRGHCKASIPDYQEQAKSINALYAGNNGKQRGDPKKGVKVMIEYVLGKGAASGRARPPVIALGVDGYEIAKKACEDTLERLEEWKEMSCSTDFA